MLGNREFRGAAWLWLLASLGGVGACNSVLGIEDLHPGPRGGVANGNGATNSTTSGQTAGGNQNAAGSSKGGTQNSGANAGSGNGGTTSAGSSNEAGTGSGGEGAAPGSPVHGKVVDLWGTPLPNITIEVAGQLGATDAQGEFDFADVPEQYDASLVIKIANPEHKLAWVYQGVTRRDPTFQVYQGRQLYDTLVTVQPTNVPATLPASDVISVAFGFPFGAREIPNVKPAGKATSVEWAGGPTTTGAAHALLWSFNETTKAPTAYQAYQTQAVALDDSVQPQLTFDLTPGTLPSGTVSGTVTPAGAGERKDVMFLRFDSHAAISLMASTPSSNTFSYTVPTGIPNSGITLVAAEGGVFSHEPTALAHADGLAAGATDVKLTIPTPATIVQPDGAAAEGVTSDTLFKFRPGAKNDGPFVVAFLGGGRNDRIYLVTASTEFKLPPILQGSYTLAPGGLYRWWVETHGDYASVDEMLTPNGFLDAFTFGWDSPPFGPRQKDGSYTATPMINFLMAK